MSYRSGNMEPGGGWHHPAGTRWEEWDTQAQCHNNDCPTYDESEGYERECWPVYVRSELGATYIVEGDEECPRCGEGQVELI